MPVEDLSRHFYLIETDGLLECEKKPVSFSVFSNCTKLKINSVQIFFVQRFVDIFNNMRICTCSVDVFRTN